MRRLQTHIYNKIQEDKLPYLVIVIGSQKCFQVCNSILAQESLDVRF